MLDRRRFCITSCAGLGLALGAPAFAQFRVEISGVGGTQLPIAIPRFRNDDQGGVSPSAIIRADLERSGAFRIVDSPAALDETSAPAFSEWRSRAADALVGGSVARLADGRIGRFGWKGEFATLNDFVKAACANELGLSNPDRPQATPLGKPGHKATGVDLTDAQCISMTDFIRGLPTPTEVVPDDPTHAKAVAAGVKVAMGTDSGVTPHGQNLRELALMVEGGMTPMQAIVATTRSAAELMGLQDELGTLEQGKRADLVLVEGDPLEVATLADRVTEVYKDGERLV